jgi:hypothetical protein
VDKNIDLAARILMSRAFSAELVAAKHDVSYLQNSDSQVEIPLRVTGQLPKPAVVPDVGVLAQRAASHAIEGKIGGLLGGKKGGGLLGGLLGGGGSGGNAPAPGAGAASPGGSAPANPLNQLKGLFH